VDLDSSSSSSDAATNSYQIGGGAGNAEGAERSLRSYSYRHHSRPKRVVPPATSIPRFRKYAVDDFNFLKVLGKGSFGKVRSDVINHKIYYDVMFLVMPRHINGLLTYNIMSFKRTPSYWKRKIECVCDSRYLLSILIREVRTREKYKSFRRWQKDNAKNRYYCSHGSNFRVEVRKILLKV